LGRLVALALVARIAASKDRAFDPLDMAAVVEAVALGLSALMIPRLIPRLMKLMFVVVAALERPRRHFAVDGQSDRDDIGLQGKREGDSLPALVVKAQESEALGQPDCRARNQPEADMALRGVENIAVDLKGSFGHTAMWGLRLVQESGL
jgi:hypothetical protein